MLDPFCGSGTLLVEAVLAGRNAIGSDVDPLATFISDAKTRNYDLAGLDRIWTSTKARIEAFRRARPAHLDFTFEDLKEAEFDSLRQGLWLPLIPNIDHWFRRYVQIDLARLADFASDTGHASNDRAFLQLVLASIIRASSNADPVPVSGLEVTSHMKKKDEDGRFVDPLSLYLQRGERTLKAIKLAAKIWKPGFSAEVFAHDARDEFTIPSVDSIMTSPPYQSAVDYYRRHQLEMFWLGLTRSQEDRLALLPGYVGRPNIPMKDPYSSEKTEFDGLPGQWLAEISSTSERRARDFRAYFSSMRTVFARLGAVAKPGAQMVLVVGRSKWGEIEIPTEELFKQLVPKQLAISDHLVYRIQNRYMSYTRKNGANIEHEHVLVFKKAS